MSSSSSSPAILPISTPHPYISPSFISHLSISLRHALSRRRPWSELTNRSQFSKPNSFPESIIRIRKNYSYFRINYFIVITLILSFSLFSNPSSLFLLLALLSSWLFLYLFRPSDHPLVLFGRVFKDSEVLIGLVVLSVCVVFFSSVGSVLVSGIGGGVAVVCVHGALRSPDDLFLDQHDVDSTSFFNLFFPGNGAVAGAGAPPSASRM